MITWTYGNFAVIGWWPHNLTEAQKQARVKWNKEMLKKFNRDQSNLVYNIVTGNETWIYSYESECKQSTVWVFQNEPILTKVVRSRSAAKKMIACFFLFILDMWQPWLQRIEGGSVNTNWYTTICLPEVINELRRTPKSSHHSSSWQRQLSHSTSNRWFFVQ